YGDLQIINRAGRGGKMQDIVHPARNMDKGGHIMVIELETLEVEQVFDVPQVPGDQIVHPDDMVPFGNETIAEMGSQKACCSGDEGLFHKTIFLLFFSSCFYQKALVSPRTALRTVCTIILKSRNSDQFSI